jgi:hypothetical protein
LSPPYQKKGNESAFPVFSDFLLDNMQTIPARNIASCMHYVSSSFTHWLACTLVIPFPASNIVVFDAFRVFSAFSLESITVIAARMHFPPSQIYYWLAGISVLGIMLIHSAVRPPSREPENAHLLSRVTRSQAQSQRDAGLADLLARWLPYQDLTLKTRLRRRIVYRQ